MSQCNTEAPWCDLIDFGTEEGDILDFNTFNVGFGLFMDSLYFDGENVASDPASA